MINYAAKFGNSLPNGISIYTEHMKPPCGCSALVREAMKCLNLAKWNPKLFCYFLVWQSFFGSNSRICIIDTLYFVTDSFE